jgi:phosphomannomutase
MSLFDQSIFRAYDMRGTYPNQINEQVAYAAGQAFVHVMKAKTVAVGRDVRATGPGLEEALVKGITDAGANAIRIGVISTEMLYFAAATLDCDGGMSVTASHNPAQWNGIKFIGKGAAPISKEGQLGEIYQFINEGHKLSAFEKGSYSEADLLPAYIEYLKKFTPTDLPNLKIAANANFGANGKYIDAALSGLPIELLRLNWNEDGTFPKGTPDPLLPKNRKEVQELIVSQGAHFGAAWDADADRCFFYDEKGRPFHGAYVTAMLIKHFFEVEKGGTAIGERRIIWPNLAAAEEGGGKLVFSRTGHGYIKKAMRENDAVFGGEVSGHFYYRDYFFCDSGLVSFLTALGVFAKEIAKGRTVSALLDSYRERFPISDEELNYITPRAQEIIDAASAKYADAEQNHEDGLSVMYPDWRFNLRMSSNEPVLRLNYEAKTREKLEWTATEIQSLIGSFGAELRNDNE